ncbi:MAG: OmpA family protein [Candidatus Kapabacteria bacterium]|nr:OmpA family protein [Candidatus Kapabacteria bacterium]
MKDVNWKIDYFSLKLGIDYKFSKSDKPLIPFNDEKVKTVIDTIKLISEVKKDEPKPETKFLKIKSAKFKELNYFENIKPKSHIPIYNLFFEKKSDKILETNEELKLFYTNSQIFGNLKDLEQLNFIENVNYEVIIYLDKNENYSDELFKKRTLVLLNMFEKYNIKSKNIKFKSEILNSIAEEIENYDKVNLNFIQTKYFGLNVIKKNINGILEIELEKNTQSPIFINSDFVNYIETSNRNNIEIPFNINDRIVSNEIDLNNFEFLLLFEFNSSELNDRNISILNQFVQLAKNKEIEIIGSADNIGDSKVNEEIAISRANVVGNYINNNSTNIKTNIKTIQNKYPEDFPQGRILNRSVKIKIIN